MTVLKIANLIVMVIVALALINDYKKVPTMDKADKVEYSFFVMVFCTLAVNLYVL